MNESHKTRAKQQGMKPASVLSTALLIICTIACFVVVIRTAFHLDTKVFGYRLFYVATGSMEPTLPVHSLLFVKEKEDYAVGDIVTFYSKDQAISGEPNTHRIVAKNEDAAETTYCTKGDANKSPDADLITERDIIGKVCFSMKSTGVFGSFFGFLSTRFGFFFLVLIPVLLIAISCMRDFKKAFRKELERAAKEAAEKEANEGSEESPQERE